MHQTLYVDKVKVKRPSNRKVKKQKKYIANHYVYDYCY